MKAKALGAVSGVLVLAAPRPTRQNSDSRTRFPDRKSGFEVPIRSPAALNFSVAPSGLAKKELDTMSSHRIVGFLCALGLVLAGPSGIAGRQGITSRGWEGGKFTARRADSKLRLV